MRKYLGRMLMVAAASSMALSAAAKAAITVDGSLDPSYGAPLAVQTNVSNVPMNAPSGPGPITQLSAGYGVIGGGNLNLFLAGSVSLDDFSPGTDLIIAIDANPTKGSSNMNGDSANLPGSLSKVQWDAGFQPETLLRFQFDGGRIYTSYDLVNNTPGVATGYNITDPASPPSPLGTVTTYSPAGAPAVTFAVNNALENVLVGSGAVGDPGFAGANTGFELQMSLADLGYTGGDIGISAFITQGSNTAITNQILGAYTPNPDANPFDYIYIDSNRQFDNQSDYPGNQFFVIPTAAAVPLPASAWMILLALPVALWCTKRRPAAI